MQLFSPERIVEANYGVMSTEKCMAFCTRLEDGLLAQLWQIIINPYTA